MPQMILLSTLLLSAISEITSPPDHFQEYVEPAFHSLVDSTLYFGAGTVFGTVALVSSAGWSVCQIFPEMATVGGECLLASQILGVATVHSFSQAFKKTPFFSCLFKQTPSSYSAWENNKQMLSKIPAFSRKDQELLHFLQTRWLAKTTGCYPFLANWMCPAFGISFQVHPETTNSYARDPATKLFDTYKNRMNDWKQKLPHPEHFPLILTHPADISRYLPSENSSLIVNVTHMLPREKVGREELLRAWHVCEDHLSKYCHEQKIDLNKVICIQRVEQQELGGVRLLPFSSTSRETIEKHHQFLLEWVSRFGLSANRIELDRLSPFCDASSSEEIPAILEKLDVQDEWLSCLSLLEGSFKSDHAQKNLMFKGTLQVLKDLCLALPEASSETSLLAAKHCFTSIKKKLESLVEKESQMSFHEMVSHIEQVHADLSSLLEIFSPFTKEDFINGFQKHLTVIPRNLQRLARYGIHSSSMTSFAGIFKAVQETLGRTPRVLYGDNIYFECSMVANRISKALPMLEATEQDWEDVDLILAQFNPTVKRISFKVTEYQAAEYQSEKISEFLHKALAKRKGRPLSIAIDCTLDFSNSRKVGNLLSEFQEEIEKGKLNVICYRSGLKFDLFGMDNYCGAPFYMIHSQDEKWSHFDTLLNDPVLQTDRLSLNWFSLVYKNSALYLEEYRKQIFDNTRAVLDKTPVQLFDPNNTRYRVIPVDPEADPTFIDIKIFGPLHSIRGGLLVAVFLTLKNMEAGHPLLYRPGIGFYHPNLAVLYGDTCTTVRLTVGLDPSQIDVMVGCLEKLNKLNGCEKAVIQKFL